VSQIPAQVDELGPEAQNSGSLGAGLAFLYIKELEGMCLTRGNSESFGFRTSDVISYSSFKQTAKK